MSDEPISPNINDDAKQSLIQLFRYVYDLIFSSEKSDEQPTPSPTKRSAEDEAPTTGRTTGFSFDVPVPSSPGPSAAKASKKNDGQKKVKVDPKVFASMVSDAINGVAQSAKSMPQPLDAKLVELPPGLVPLYNHQQYGLRWLIWREGEYPNGGILADEMGLGKTIMLIALMMKSKQDEFSFPPSSLPYCTCKPTKTNLVVCPPGCLNQWHEEITKKGHGLSVYKFHGQWRTISESTLMSHDVILTTYQTLVHEPDTSPIMLFQYRRIILDEAHLIKNPKTESAERLCKLEAKSRWAVTGTPIHNTPGDFYSLIKFLRMTPMDNEQVWDYWIGMKVIRRRAGAVERLHTLGKTLLLRRTKDEVEAGGEIATIPPKTVRKVTVRLSHDEMEIYEQLRQKGRNLVTEFQKKNKNAVGYMHILALLTRLRQCAVLPHLICMKMEEEEEEDGVDGNVMFDGPVNPIVFERMYLSSKIARLLQDLEEMRQQKQPMDKVVVVSCWRSTLVILHEHLWTRGFTCLFITGMESPEERTRNQERFNKDSNCQILLLSLTAGGIGLNLVGGNHVMFLEPHWNPQLELQAQDRVHRYGQTKPVTVTRYIVKDTVEERILEIQDKKVDLADGVLNSGKRILSGGLNFNLLKRLLK